MEKNWIYYYYFFFRWGGVERVIIGGAHELPPVNFFFKKDRYSNCLPKKSNRQSSDPFVLE